MAHPKKSKNLVPDTFYIPQLAFPHNQNFPASLFHGIGVTSVAQPVGSELLFPETLVCFWRPRKLASDCGMFVPKAAVHVDGRLVPRQHNVWPTRKITSMKRKSEPLGPNQLPDRNFRGGVSGAYPPHKLASIRLG
jgi:hypothetical protein